MYLLLRSWTFADWWPCTYLFLSSLRSSREMLCSTFKEGFWRWNTFSRKYVRWTWLWQWFYVANARVCAYFFSKFFKIPFLYFIVCCCRWIFSCGAVVPPPGFHNERDLSKKYPDCCVKYVKDGTKNEEAEPVPSST